MTINTWLIPRADVGVFSGGTGSGFSFVPSGATGTSLAATRGLLAGAGDRLLDPNTLDYVRNERGEWVETADSRTSVLIAISTELGTSPFTPAHGTAIAARRRLGLLSSPEFVQAETVRAMGILAAGGLLSELEVAVRDQDGNVLVDDTGRRKVKTAWRDLASGSPINSEFAPR